MFVRCSKMTSHAQVHEPATSTPWGPLSRARFEAPVRRTWQRRQRWRRPRTCPRTAEWSALSAAEWSAFGWPTGGPTGPRGHPKHRNSSWGGQEWRVWCGFLYKKTMDGGCGGHLTGVPFNIFPTKGIPPRAQILSAWGTQRFFESYAMHVWPIWQQSKQPTNCYTVLLVPVVRPPGWLAPTARAVLCFLVQAVVSGLRSRQDRVLCVTQSHAAAMNLHKRLEVLRSEPRDPVGDR